MSLLGRRVTYLLLLFVSLALLPCSSLSNYRYKENVKKTPTNSGILISQIQCFYVGSKVFRKYDIVLNIFVFIDLEIQATYDMKGLH